MICSWGLLVVEGVDSSGAARFFFVLSGSVGELRILDESDWLGVLSSGGEWSFGTL